MGPSQLVSTTRVHIQVYMYNVWTHVTTLSLFLTGPLYVMIPPSSNGADLLQAAMQHSPNQTGQRPIIPRLTSGAILLVKSNITNGL